MPRPGGDHRDTLGADAGRDSIRTVSGALLKRRAGVGVLKNATAHLNQDADDNLRNRDAPIGSVGALESDHDKFTSY